MLGILQIMTYLLAFFLVIKGCEVLMISLASEREDRNTLVTFGAFLLGLCIVVAVVIVLLMERQVKEITEITSPFFGRP